MGATVQVWAADVTDRESMCRPIQGIGSDAPLSVVFHAAGIPDVTPLLELSPGRLAEVLAAKREGTQVLEELTANRDLDAFVCFSSIAGVWGAGQQGAYAAANAFEDAWCQQARLRGRSAVSIAWGPWAGAGMADEEAQAELARRGLRGLDPADALAAMECMLLTGAGHAVVADVDWDRFATAFEAFGARALLAEVRVGESGGGPAGPQDGHPLADELAELPSRKRKPLLLRWIQCSCAEVLGMAKPEDLDTRRGFAAQGMDSLMAVELRRRLEQGLGIKIPASVTFDHPDPHALADYLLLQLPESSASCAPKAPADSASTGEQPVHSIDDVEAMSEDEAIALIQEAFEEEI
jgi:acyl carrier protein